MIHYNFSQQNFNISKDNYPQYISICLEIFGLVLPKVFSSDRTEINSHLKQHSQQFGNYKFEIFPICLIFLKIQLINACITQCIITSFLFFFPLLNRNGFIRLGL